MAKAGEVVTLKVSEKSIEMVLLAVIALWVINLMVWFDFTPKSESLKVSDIFCRGAAALALRTKSGQFAKVASIVIIRKRAMCACVLRFKLINEFIGFIFYV